MFGTVTPLDLRKAIAETLWAHVSAHDLADVCVFLGLKPQEKDENPFFSKRGYVGKRLLDKGIVELADLARRLVEEYGDQDLRQLVERLGPHGVSGELKNLIFSADGPKPRIVLRDAINNVIEIVENAEYCLVYDRPLAEHGLTWRELAVWWAQQHDLSADERTHARGLYERLCRSLANEAEHLLFRTYCALYGREGGFELPALIPQVYLHYDPYTRRQLAEREGALKRQRMDFLLLLPHRARVVIEVDGVQHYSRPDGAADPTLYAEMVSEDRALRLSGYEVYRFGGQELCDLAGSKAALLAFFQGLLARHGHH